MELPSNPFDGKLIKDGAAHRIEVSAPGHAAQRRMLVFDRDIELEVTLSHAQRGPAPATTATSKVVKPPVEADPTVPPPKPDPY